MTINGLSCDLMTALTLVIIVMNIDDKEIY